MCKLLVLDRNTRYDITVCTLYKYLILYNLCKLSVLGILGIIYLCPVGRSHRIHYNTAEWQDSSNEYPVYDTKQSDGEASELLELLGIRSVSSLLSLPSPLLPGVVTPDRFYIYGSNRIKLCSYAKMNCFK